jgi:hypothetical protein
MRHSRGALALVVVAVVAALALSPSRADAEPATARARVVVLDDGEKVARDRDHPLAPGPWPSGTIDLFAMRGETIALQVVIEAAAREVEGAHAVIGALYTEEGSPLDAVVDLFAERFVAITRASGGVVGNESLAFTAKAAPRGYVGWMADALVPFDVAGDLRIAPETRGAIWIDVTVPAAARPGTYRGALLVRDDGGEIDARTIALRVVDRDLPYAAAKTMIYYDAANLAARMGDARAERDLRHLLHAHHVSAIHPVNDRRDVAIDLEALSGEAFTPARGYRGPGEGIGERVFAIGSYGSLGEPGARALDAVDSVARLLRERGVFDATDTFVYAVDEECESPWGARWVDLARRRTAMRGVRVGVTCGRDPVAQAADLVMMTPEDLVPARARIAKATRDQWVWAYNGRRPFAGAMVLDVPAVDLRANAWIAARYDVDRWFYWESTFWRDANEGGRGRASGDAGFDPFVVAETFHNADGDWSNGDGILVYPGAQRGVAADGAAMTDFGVSGVFPSVRLKNVRRGVEDAGYIALARVVDRARADAIVRRVVPRALALAPSTKRAAWPERGAAWIEARRALLALIERTEADATSEEATRGDVREAVAMSDGCSVSATKSCVPKRAHTSVRAHLALILFVVIARRARSRRRADRFGRLHRMDRE